MTPWEIVGGRWMSRWIRGPRQQRARWRLALAVCLGGWQALAGAADAAPTAAAAAVPVVASFSILGDIVQQIGGERVSVRTLVGPEADAHVYQPKPADARAVAAAKLLVVNGLGYEGWLERLLRSAGYRGELVRVTDGIEPLPAVAPQPSKAHAAAPRRGHAHGHDHRHDHDHGAFDPHAWQDVRNVMVYAQRIADALCRVDAPSCDGYRQRAQAYQQTLRALDADIRAAWAAIPAEQRKIVTSHDAFRYYGNAYGVTFLPAQGVSTASEPSAAGVARLIRQIRAEGVRAVFVERLTDPRLVQRIARESGVQPASEPLYSDALSRGDGPAPDYVRLMRHNTQAMVTAVRGATP
ncbi:metal ABC transporter solute-binding protein, Zn/Mn family [Tepidimonas taiwanensis]|uniref:metal ABC transporter solute-binding protein, Zn/Mn family n=1 Tax=Tepidimonas taiwanensis TaxID=307486 RepID=UPI000A44C0B2|nr:zinc ABC transporter substrate-binding protein [Tepidimonas taiwanensis]